MKFLFDLFPVLVFFGTYKIADFNQEAAAASATHFFGWMASTGVITNQNGPTTWATLATIVGTLLQVIWLKARGKRVDRMLLVTFAIIVTLGGATVWLQNDAFIRMKPTVLDWILALVFLIAEFGFKKNLAREALGKAIQLPEPVWRNVVLSWIGFFTFIGALNLYVALNYSMAAWVNFKFYGLVGLPFVFVIAQVLMLAKYIEEEPQE
jgi:intracellular septation protein